MEENKKYSKEEIIEIFDEAMERAVNIIKKINGNGLENLDTENTMPGLLFELTAITSMSVLKKEMFKKEK